LVETLRYVIEAIKAIMCGVSTVEMRIISACQHVLSLHALYTVNLLLKFKLNFILLSLTDRVFRKCYMRAACSVSQMEDQAKFKFKKLYLGLQHKR